MIFQIFYVVCLETEVFMSDLIFFKEHRKTDDSILLEVQLNHPKKLNALNTYMIQSLRQELEKWKAREELSAVFIHSDNEKAFCAGGDVAELYYRISESQKKNLDPVPFAKEFFHTEYESNYLMTQFPKPIIVWGNGIVMGGGLGLFMSSSHPIATENSLFSMPEVGIGFFPDVGASYFLNQIPNQLGKYLALTSCRWNARGAQFLGLTSWFFDHKDKQKIFDFLKQKTFKNTSDFDFQFRGLKKEPPFLSQQSCWIEDFEKEIMKALEFKDLASFYDYFSQMEIKDPQWIKNCQAFLQASPNSLAVVFEQLKRAQKEIDLKTIFEMESVLALHLSCSDDFLEGVRALLIDKCKKPKWNPKLIEEISPENIRSYFMPKNHWDCSLKI